MTDTFARVGPFKLGKTLGVGSTGKVKLGTHKDTGQTVAIKIVEKSMLNSRPSLKRKIEREIAVLKVIDHPNVLRLFDVFETPQSLFLVLEHVQGGELFDYLVGKGRLPPSEALTFFQQIISGLDYCHTCLICHRDLKPENLLLDSNNQIKIADFGFASLMRDDDLLETSCGSPHYAAPEVVQGLKYDGTASDVWSCGVILFALLTGKLPFDDDNIPRLLSKVKAGKFQMPSHLPPDVQDLISRMLTVDPEQRITIPEIKRHPWMRSNGQMDDEENPLASLGELVFDPDVEKDQEILDTLQVLGWGTEEEVLQALHSSEYNLEKVFYRLLERRTLEKEAMLTALYPDDVSSGSDNSTPEGSPLEGSKYLSTRRKSKDIGSPNIKASSKNTGSVPVPASRTPKGMTVATNSSAANSAPLASPKKSWFSNMFDKNKKRASVDEGNQSTFGLHSQLSLNDVSVELKRALEKLGIKWKMQGTSIVKAKYVTPANSVVKFRIEVRDLGAGQGLLLNFTLRQGDIQTYRSLYEFIQKEIRI